MSINLEIICIGNELLIGKTRDTNAHYLTKQITHLGASVTRVTIIQDNIEEIAQCINETIARKPRFIITTGGLGPTFDDKTLQGIAKALNKKLAVNLKAIEMVRQKCYEYAKKRGHPLEVEITPPRIKMATIPENAKPISNPVGTAPGVRVDFPATILFALPGVRLETEAIFNQTIRPQVERVVGDRVFCEHSVFIEDIFESRLAPLIDEVMRDNIGVYVKSHPMSSENKPRVELNLTITQNSTSNPEERLRKAVRHLKSLIAKKGGLVTLG